MIDKIIILGDFNPIHSTLHLLNDSTRQVQKYLNREIQFDWISTDIFDAKVVFENKGYKGLWIAPGSPYRDMQNVINAIEYTRKNNIPTFGNCGGFQHMIIEFAKNICKIEKADHEETNPKSSDLLIKRLACSLKGEQENLTLINKKSLLYQTIKADKILGKYYCSFGINSKYVDILAKHGLIFTSKSEEGEFRSFEIKNHPFFIGTLFQPALTSTKENPNPLIIEFIKKSLKIATTNMGYD
ncbi:CTP synthase [Flavobacteriaceae bacterium MHTCC 0001]